MNVEYLDILFTVIGTVGVAVILLAFLLLQSKRLTADHLRYQFLNIGGSLLMLVSLLWKWNTPSVIIQCCWIAISLYAIVRIRRESHQKHKEQSHDEQ